MTEKLCVLRHRYRWGSRRDPFFRYMCSFIGRVSWRNSALRCQCSFPGCLDAALRTRGRHTKAQMIPEESEVSRAGRPEFAGLRTFAARKLSIHGTPGHLPAKLNEAISPRAAMAPGTAKGSPASDARKRERETDTRRAPGAFHGIRRSRKLKTAS